MARLVPGIHYEGDWVYLLIAGVVFGLLNLIVKPLVTVLSLPVVVLSLGLFFIVINAFILYLASWLLDGLTIDGCGPALLGGVVIALEQIPDAIADWVLLVEALDRQTLLRLREHELADTALMRVGFAEIQSVGLYRLLHLLAETELT